ncbi:MAG TPA: AtzG-like protein [Methylophilaceae bacterium]
MSKLVSKPPSAGITALLSSDQFDALLSFHGFDLNEVDKTAVQTHMQIISTHAINVMSFPLTESCEPAPIYRP